MNNARIVDMEIWGGDQNIIEGDPFLPSVPKISVVLRWRVGRAVLSWSWRRVLKGKAPAAWMWARTVLGETSRPKKAESGATKQVGLVAERLWECKAWAKWAKPLKEREVMMESEQRDWVGGVMMDKKATRSSKMKMVIR